LVRSDRQQCEIEWTIPPRNLTEGVVECGVAREEHAMTRARDRPPTPECTISVADATRAEMLRRCARDLETVNVRLVPPIQRARSTSDRSIRSPRLSGSETSSARST